MKVDFCCHPCAATMLIFSFLVEIIPLHQRGFVENDNANQHLYTTSELWTNFLDQFYGAKFFGPKFFQPKFFQPKFFQPKFFGPKMYGPKFYGAKFFGPEFFGPKIFGLKFFGPEFLDLNFLDPNFLDQFFKCFIKVEGVNCRIEQLSCCFTPE